MRKSQQSGVTLVELLIAIFILGVATSVVVLNAPSAGQSVEREAKRLAARLKAASDEAVTTGTVVGFVASPSSYRFERYRDGAWEAIDSRILGEWFLESEITLEINLEQSAGLKANDRIISGGGSIRPSLSDDETKAAQPLVQFRPIGEDIPMTAILSGASESWQVVLMSDGQITLRRHEEN